MKKKPTFTPARLMDVTGATTKEKLSKRWLVIYYVWSEARQEKVRKRIEVNGDTIKARQEEAEPLIAEINSILEAGAVIDPVEDSKIVKPESSLSENESVLSRETLLEVAFMKLFLPLKKSELKEQSYKTYKKAARKFEAFLKMQKTPFKVKTFNEHLAHQFA